MDSKYYERLKVWTMNIHIYKLVQTSSFKQRKMHLSQKLKMHPDCSQVETNLCTPSDKSGRVFPVCHLQIYIKQWFAGLPLKRVISPSFPPPLLLCSQPSQWRCFHDVISVIPSVQKVCWLLEAPDTLCSTLWVSWNLLCMLQVIRVSRKNVHLFTEGTL